MTAFSDLCHQTSWSFRVVFHCDVTEKQNRRILEQLEEQKKRLRGHSNSSTPATGASTQPGQAVTSGIPSLISEPQHITPQQRTALQHAHQHSVGYFITQDSIFGNLILPVIPRFDKG